MLQRDGGNTIEVFKKAIDLTARALEQLRVHVTGHGFTSQDEEIEFFKTCKPAVEHLHLYYHHLFEMVLCGVTQGSFDEVILQRQLDKINGFYAEHTFLVKYYRSGATYLDDKLFVRAPNDGTWMPLQSGCDIRFTAVCDQFLSILLAYEKLQLFIHGELRKPLSETATLAVDGVEKKFKWTDSKAALIELLYALQRKGSINHGEVELKDIAQFFETVFGIDLGNYYRTFQEIRIRKSGRTNYLDQLKKVLLGYMDETDLSFKG